jgi:hypothetical protein
LDLGVSWVNAGLDNTASDTTTASVESEKYVLLIIEETPLGTTESTMLEGYVAGSELSIRIEVIVDIYQDFSTPG